MTQNNHFMSTHSLLAPCFTLIPITDGNEGGLALESLFNRVDEGGLKL